jgi:5'-nucleotidase (lipoprotein e(P4) family)
MMPPIRNARALATTFALSAITGCGASRRVTTAPVPVAATAPAPRNDIHWVRSSAEYRGIALEVYRSAAEHLPGLIRDQRAGTWAVILDADETVLDNSLSERRDADLGRAYSETAWAAWVRESAATAIPGAVDFTRQVHALGGKVVIVSNRPDSLCAPTRENLTKIGVAADMVLCGPAGVTDKNPRFERVQQGTAVPGVPPLHVVEWIGDNIEDFPALHQSVRSTPDGYRDFGVKYFLLPNPMYGSWVRNAEP